MPSQNHFPAKVSYIFRCKVLIETIVNYKNLLEKKLSLNYRKESSCILLLEALKMLAEGTTLFTCI